MEPLPASAPPPESPRTPPPLPALTPDEQLLAAIQGRGDATATKGGSGGMVLVVTGVLFLAAGGLHWGWRTVGYLAAAIAIHEVGHVLAMRASGYKNVRMLFVPFFGGLATGQPSELDATRNALIALAGPAAGLASAVLAAGAGVALGQPPWLGEFAWISIGLNGLNLLPFVPLDGGQVANDTLFSRYPILETIFRLVAIAGLAWLTWALQAWLLGVLPLFLLFSLTLAHRRACLIRDARRDPAWQNRELNAETAGLLRDLVRRIFARMPPRHYESKMAEHAHGVWLEIRKRFPTPGATVGLLAAYLALALLVVPAIAGFVSALYGAPGD